MFRLTFKHVEALISFSLIVLPNLVCAQGENNLTGVTGGFNGWVTSAGQYDPYTGNARRVVTDLVVPGAVGSGLTWTRYLNTRYPTSAWWSTDFERGGWGDNWNWLLSAGTGTLFYPTGESFAITPAQGGTYNIPGTGDQLRPSGSDFYLYRSDGSKVFFKNVSTQPLRYQAQQIIDPYGLITTISYNSIWISQITDPSGRWLKITRDPNTEHITRVDSIDGQWVAYSYGTFGQYSVSVLTGVSYSDGTSASYTYQTCNVGNYGGVYYGDSTPLALFLSDCRADSSIQQIKYTFVSGGAPGFLSAELNSSGQAVSTLQIPNNNTRVEVRGDGQTRTFNYSNALLTSRSQFNGVSYYFWYDSNSFINKIQDPDTHQTQIQRTQFGTITQIIHPDGSSRTITYTDSNNPYWIASIQNELGHTTTFTRDANHRVQNIHYADSTNENFVYNSLGEVTQHQQQDGASEWFTYNGNGQLTAYQDFVNQQYNIWWNSAWLCSGVQEVARNIGKLFYYNNRGQVTSLENPDGTTKAFTYNNYGWQTGWSDENGHTWQTNYDAYGRVSTKVEPLGRTAQFFYARPGQTELVHTANAPSQIILPSGKATEIQYDGDWRVTYETIGTGSETTTVHAIYDGLGLKTQSVDGAGGTTTYGYDNRNRVTSVTDPNGNQTTFQYDALNELLTRTDPDTNAWALTYDVMGRVSQSFDPFRVASSYYYSVLGSLISYNDPNGHNYSWTYDSDNRKTSATYPDTTAEYWQYDSAGNLGAYWTVAGSRKYYSFDVRNRLVHTNWSGSTQQIRDPVDYSYDGAGNVTEIYNLNSDISYSYDVANELVSETQSPTGGPAQTINYNYTPDGLPQGLKVPKSYGFTRRYDSRNLLNSVRDLNSATVFASYTYDSAARLMNRALPNGTSTTYSYDGGSRLTNQLESLANGATWPATVSYNNVNEITGISHNGSGDDRTFRYNIRRNLNQVTFGGPNPAAQTYGFVNDANGNWVSQQVGGTVQTKYQTNGLNGYSQLTSYDANGNPTTTTLSYDGQDNLLGLNGSSFQFNYDSQLTAGSSGTNTVQSAYDGLGRCVSRTVNGVTTYITYSGWSPIVETDSAGNIKDARVYGLGIDDLVVDLTPSLTPNFFYHEDASGNVQFVTDPNGKLIERYSYNPFGAFSIYDANWNPLSASSVGNRFYFQGREYLAGLGIYDFRNRAYSPSLGRFLQLDPIRFAGGNNLYRFAGNDPVNGGDPLGLDTIIIPTQSTNGDGIYYDPSRQQYGEDLGGNPGVQGPYDLVTPDPAVGTVNATEVQGGSGGGGNAGGFVRGAGTGGSLPSSRPFHTSGGGLPDWIDVTYDPNSPAGQAISAVGSYIGNAGPDIYTWTIYGASLAGPVGAAIRAPETIKWLVDILENGGPELGRRNGLPIGPGAQNADESIPSVLQSGGRTISPSTARTLGMERSEVGRALEALKRGEGIPNNFHGNILSNGDYVHPDTGDVLGNLFDYSD